MSRETSIYVVGDFWLDKRRDGASPDIWQIATYDAERRAVRYTSTRCREVERARELIDAAHQKARAKAPQSSDQALVAPLLMLYYHEHGQHAISHAVASSLRQFIAFLDQDGSLGVSVAQITPPLLKRFREWRMAPHSYEIEWLGKTYRNESKGVNGESVQRNLDDLRAALNHHVGMGRLPYAPKIAPVPKGLRSDPRDRVLSWAELGAMIGYVRGSDMEQWVLLMLGTMARPEAALQFDPATQWRKDDGLIDLHPPGAPRTNKRNPIVPIIPEMVPVLKAWKVKPVRSHKRAWRTMRRALGLSSDVVAKTIRHTVATRIRQDNANPLELSAVLGHDATSAGLRRTSAVYAKYDPAFVKTVKRSLSKIWKRAMAEADAWAAVHSLSSGPKGRRIVIDRNTEEAQKSEA